MDSRRNKPKSKNSRSEFRAGIRAAMGPGFNPNWDDSSDSDDVEPGSQLRQPRDSTPSSPPGSMADRNEGRPPYRSAGGITSFPSSRSRGPQQSTTQYGRGFPPPSRGIPDLFPRDSQFGDNISSNPPPERAGFENNMRDRNQNASQTANRQSTSFPMQASRQPWDEDRDSSQFGRESSQRSSPFARDSSDSRPTPSSSSGQRPLRGILRRGGPPDTNRQKKNVRFNESNNQFNQY